RHEVGEATPDIKSAVHKFWTAERLDRNPVVAEVVKAAWPAIIFCRTRHGADRLAKQLGKLDLKAAPIHGGRSQSQRNRALEDFTKGRVHALVATDVAARGIHVDGVASVIHYDPPEDHKAYVHRSGRTARAGAEGLVVSLVQPGQKNELRKMQRMIGLDEPFTEPDAGMLPEGALTGDRELAPAGPRQREPQERNRPNQRSGRSQRKHGAGRRRPGQEGGRRDDDRNRGERNDGARSRDDRGSNGQRSGGKPAGKSGQSAKNRKARRAHLQPGSNR
ncbi:helicase-related protein, partial [Ilumatobacter sp.]|uniref:helicase-related protein n=1 Tax=Ilumatobacter sp. TaxID=1967498 RepID=UPI003AF97C8E